MFSRRFIKVPIKVYDRDHMELTGSEIAKDTYEMINPYRIESYRPSDENAGNCINISMQSGATMLVYMSIREFEKALDKHSNSLNDVT